MPSYRDLQKKQAYTVISLTARSSTPAIAALEQNKGISPQFPTPVAGQGHWLQRCQRPKGNQEPLARSEGSYKQDFPHNLIFSCFFGWKKN